MIAITTTERIAIVAATLLAFIIAAACHTALRPTTIAPRETPWCVLVEMRAGDAGRICASTLARCEWAAKGVRQYGDWGRVAAVDAECVYEGVTP